MFEAEVNSGFTAGGDINISNRFTQITLLHQSSNGYSEVYKAKRFGQWHILKCLTTEATQDIQYQTLLEKEFRIAYPLSHPNIVRTFGLEKVDEIGRICIIQEYIDGEHISTISREQAIELCDAVEYIHQCGVIHRDIKPENVLVRNDNGHLVLIDFGLADKVDFSVLKGGAGTSGYAAPEQWEGESSPSVDVYGIGGVLAINKRFKRIADKCRRENPNKRYPSAQAVRKALTRKFPWMWFIVIFVLLGIVGMGYKAYLTHKGDLSNQQTQIEELQIEKAQLADRVDSLSSAYETLQRESERQIQTLNHELEREHNNNMRLRTEVVPLNTSPNRFPTAEDQRY